MRPYSTIEYKPPIQHENQQQFIRKHRYILLFFARTFMHTQINIHTRKVTSEEVNEYEGILEIDDELNNSTSDESEPMVQATEANTPLVLPPHVIIHFNFFKG